MKFSYICYPLPGINPPVKEEYPCKEMIKYKYAMKKLIYLSTLLFLFVLPMMAQQPLFPTPAKVQNGKGSFVIGKNLQVQGNGGYADKLAAALPAELKEAGLQSSPASGTIRLELTNDCKMADEAYTLVVEPNSILLQASSESRPVLCEGSPSATFPFRQR